MIAEHLDGRGLGTFTSMTVIYNATPAPRTQMLRTLAGTRQTLHPVQRNGSDPTVEQSSFDPSTGTFTVPAATVAVFVQR